ncbi:MFS transporter [Streptomyces zagrosensis]|uniref:UMF1 family MFS transporter n=1 Tax=Streptomyces zagrosensis TaxID=1042984 RepID=A0A7W9QAQ4_9ACTN|nr:MFS transporter [Streptomyces zagrosensis]MBB5936679.1 UMF1 family MFS transporter [Streptomyces zagrosensis]
MTPQRATTHGPAPESPESPENPEAAWRATRRGRWGWYGYDWAHAVFTTSVTSIFFGPFITDVCEKAADADGYLHPFGTQVLASSFFPFLVGLSVFLQVFVLPLAAVLTERYDKGVLLSITSLSGAGAATGMYAIGDTDYVLGGALYVGAAMALGASVMVVNTYLPVLAPPGRRDRTSAQGSAAGFLSGGLVLIADLLMYAKHEDWGLTEQQVVRVILLTTGLWWLVFSVVSVWLLRGYGSPPAPTRTAADSPARTSTYRASITAVRQMRRYPGASWFLVAFVLYNNGMQSVTSLVGTFAVEQLELAQDDVITAILLVQFVAFAGAVIAGRLAERIGGRTVLFGFALVWCATVITGALIPERSFMAFATLCVAAGFVVGGTYALSRSVFVSLVPAGRTAEYFGIFEMANRCLGFVGPTVFGIVLQQTGSYRTAWLSILVFFVAGAVALAPGVMARKGRNGDMATRRG